MGSLWKPLDLLGFIFISCWNLRLGPNPNIHLSQQRQDNLPFQYLKLSKPNVSLCKAWWMSYQSEQKHVEKRNVLPLHNHLHVNGIQCQDEMALGPRQLPLARLAFRPRRWYTMAWIAWPLWKSWQRPSNALHKRTYQWIWSVLLWNNCPRRSRHHCSRCGNYQVWWKTLNIWYRE